MKTNFTKTFYAFLCCFVAFTITKSNAQTTTETFEGFSVGQTTFTSAGKNFNLSLIGPSSTATFSLDQVNGYGYQASNNFISNRLNATANSSWKIACATPFTIDSLYIYPSDNSNATANQTSSVGLTFTGKLNGVTKFTYNANSGTIDYSIADVNNTSNRGFTLVDFSLPSYNSIIIDELDVTATGTTVYFAIDNFTFTPSCIPTTSTNTQTACDSFYWADKSKWYYASNTTDTVMRTNAGGCDSTITLNLTINTSNHNTTTQTACNSYSWNGRTYTASTIDTFSYDNGNGCLSVDTLFLTINASTHNVTTTTACDSYIWNGRTYTTSVTDTFSYNNINGCTSVDTLYLTIHTSTHNVTTATVCNTYSWNGRTYANSIIDTFSYTNGNGCASVDTLFLTVKHSSSSTFTTSACGSYTWALNNKVYTSSNHTDTVHLTNAAGCDSLITLDLTILANITDVHINGIGAFCGDTAKTQLSTNINSTYGSVSYEWIRLGYNEDSWQIISHDSVVDVSTVYPAQYVVKTTIAGCGTFYSNQEGVLPITNPNVGLTPGPTVELCNNNVQLFTASTADGGINKFTFYQGASVVQNDTATTYTTPILTTANNGVIYTVEATNTKPVFDGNITENFWGKPLAVSTFGPSPSFGAGHELNAVYARADSNNVYFAIAGNVQNSNRIMMFIDSKSGGYNNANYGRTAASNNAIKNLNSGNIFDPGFEADYCVGIGTDATRSQFYFDLYTLTGTASGGGGSNHYFGSNLSPASGYSIGANPANNSQTQGFEFAIPKSAIGYTGGNVRVFLLYSADNGFLSNQFLTRADVGASNYGNGIVNFALAKPNPIVIPVHTMLSACKSSKATTVIVKPNLTSTTTQAACDSLVWNAITYKTTGTYTYTATGSNGCDSIATLHLTINHPTTSTATTSACDSLWWNGTKYTVSGIYTYTTTNAVGCDSTATLNLTINHPTTSTATTSACDSLWWNGTKYTVSGIYTYTTTNVVGCDSTATLNLTINSSPVKPTIVVATTSIVVPAIGVAYTASSVVNGVVYTWSYTGAGATIHNNGDTAVTVDFDITATSGYIQVNAAAATGCTSANDTVFVTITPLPVVLRSFTAEKLNNNALIKWTSATEVNSKNFEVQRSVDGRTFNTIGIVDAKGFAASYSYTDEKPFTGVNYYRLKQVDNNGRFEYSVTGILNFKPEALNVSIYPNPASSALTINMPVFTGSTTIVVTDVYGKQVLKKITNSQQTNINIQHLVASTYLVEIITADNKKIVEKFVKE